MNCQQIDRDIFKYCDNTLSPELRAEFDAHIKECPACRNAVKLALLENEVLRNGVKIPSLSADFTSRLMDTIQEHKKLEYNFKEREHDKLSKAKLKRSTLWFAPAILAAVLLLFMILPGRISFPGQINIADNNMSKNQIVMEDAATESMEETQTEKLKSVTDEQSCSDDEIKKETLNNVTVRKAQIAPPTFSSQEKQDAMPLTMGLSIPPQEAGIKEDALSYDSKIADNLLPHDTQNMYLQPVNLPSSYKLAKIISDVNDELTFVYQISGTNKELRINISPAELSETKKGGGGSFLYDNVPQENRSMLKGAPEDQCSIDETMASGSDSLPDASISMMITKNAVTYNVTLSAGIPQQELSQVANLIKFEEEINNDNKE